MLRFTRKIKKKMGFLTPLQVDHVLEYGTVVPGPVKTVGGGLRHLTRREKNNSVLKKFEFNDEIVLIEYVEKKDYTLIIDAIVQYKSKVNSLKC